MGDEAKIIESVYDAFTRGDVRALSALFDPQVEARQSPLLPWGGAYKGFLGMMRHITKLIEHLDWRVDIEEYIEAGPQVAVIGYTRGRVKATGKEFKLRLVHVWTLKDGKIVRYESYIDAHKMLQLLGE